MNWIKIERRKYIQQNYDIFKRFLSSKVFLEHYYKYYNTGQRDFLNLIRVYFWHSFFVIRATTFVKWSEQASKVHVCGKRTNYCINCIRLSIYCYWSNFDSGHLTIYYNKTVIEKLNKRAVSLKGNQRFQISYSLC